jgi:choline dehydrogenase
VPRNDDFNGATQEGVGYYQLFTRQGWRCSTAVAYLKPARVAPTCASKPTPTLRASLRGHARGGVRYRQRPGPRGARAREVILSAGALQSPQLLQLSGVGDAARLQALGIPVTHHLPGVGENLQDHLQLRLMYKVQKPITTNDDLQSWWRTQFKIGWKWITERKGPLAIGINQGGMFTRMMPESTTPDIQFHFASVSAEMAGAKPHPFSGFTIACASCGRIRAARVFVKSRDPMQAPACSPTTCRTETDRRCAVESLKFARHLAAAPALGDYIREEYRPGPGVASDEEPWTGLATTAPRSSTRPAPARWATTRWPWSTRGCACAAWPGCAWSTARSCRRWCRATPTRRW